MAAKIWAGVIAGNSSTPDSIKNALNPRTPIRINGFKSYKLSGINPPQNPTSTHVWPLAALIFKLKLATVVVGGMAFNGISITVVTPPDAAALVPVSNPSHSVLPGSFKWTCASTSPGIITAGVTFL
ncbi:conserved hypothetical protein [Candida albicans WO-1]|uniref:Uncharacterized protein n=2 Tax=Candida albicans TaxID=5476 RepID=Q5A7L4_CANAL|nr:uncharacterized protein CAALFM_C300190WA [Candida albicans SC5314]AOW28069.1 hypothetical protein CAALFM_C300190WA [Candida albicans SC5314]EEQ44093.1 conserved hypothetical protein [Candida albicans WO-1]|eukprot:XP_717823.1 hypothetical protein CAALFM_C300190WA [Candida albicans SC5314]